MLTFEHPANVLGVCWVAESPMIHVDIGTLLLSFEY